MLKNHVMKKKNNIANTSNTSNTSNTNLFII